MKTPRKERNDANDVVRCDDCGRYMVMSGGATYAIIYDFVAMEPSHDHTRCGRCTERLGAAQSNARPWDGDMTPFEHVYK